MDRDEASGGAAEAEGGEDGPTLGSAKGSLGDDHAEDDQRCEDEGKTGPTWRLSPKAMFGTKTRSTPLVGMRRMTPTASRSGLEAAANRAGLRWPWR